MKKKTIIIICIVMGLCFTALLYLQVKYFRQMFDMRKVQFAESVSRSLMLVSRDLELERTAKGLEQYVRNNHSGELDSMDNNILESKDSFVTPLPSEMLPHNLEGELSSMRPMPHPVELPKGFVLRKRVPTPYSSISKNMKDYIRKQYLSQRELLNQVAISILYDNNKVPVSKSINYKLLDQSLRAELKNNGIDIDYHFTVKTDAGRELYRCPDYSPVGEEYSFKKMLLPLNSSSNNAILTIHFPEMNSYLYSSVQFLLPSIIFTIILLVTFMFTIVVSFRQKKLSEMKNDFVNNMTHELKTPVSSISLAVQMLLDPNVSKSEKFTQQLANIISDETRRLRMLIDVVLQTSIFEGRKIRFNGKNLQADKIISDTVNTFSIKARKEGGSLETDFRATDNEIFADEMHFTNVLFNIMDTAYKYRKPDADFHLKVSTWNEHDYLKISIRDNGIGMKHEDLKKIFDKFYRVHTGNRHDVKGFGLGLAYVKSIVDLHHGKIHVESELGKGSEFIISLPLIKESTN